jgi:hypothetical protein
MAQTQPDARRAPTTPGGYAQRSGALDSCVCSGRCGGWGVRGSSSVCRHRLPSAPGRLELGGSSSVSLSIRRLLVGIVGLVVVAAGGVGSASGAPSPGQSRCGSVSVSPDVVKVNQRVSAVGHLTGGAGCGTSFGWLSPPGPPYVISGCGSNQPSCSYYAPPNVDSPYVTSTIPLCISGGGWASCAQYKLLGCPRGRPCPTLKPQATCGHGLACPLLLSVGGASSIRAGLSFERAGSGDSTAFLTRTDPAVCLSGCDPIVVKVTKHGVGVPGAPVTVRVGSLVADNPKFEVIPTYPDADPQPKPYVCRGSTSDKNTDGACDERLLTATTDSSGTARFVFWTPGVITPYSISLEFQAPPDANTDRQFLKIHVAPNTIRWGSNREAGAELTLQPSDPLLQTLKDWAVVAGFAKIAEDQVAGQAPSVTSVLNAILEQAGQQAAKRGLGWIQVVQGTLSQLQAEEDLTGLVMERFEIARAGLPSDATSSFARAWAGQDKASDLLTRGIFTNYGAALATKGHGAQVLRLTVLEMSYCEQGRDCGVTTDPAGIKRYLYLGFEAGDKPGSLGGPSALPVQFFGNDLVPYDATKWMTATDVR